MQRACTIGLGAVLLGAGCGERAPCPSTLYTRDDDGDTVVDLTRTWAYDEQGRLLTYVHDPSDGEPYVENTTYVDRGDWTDITSDMTLGVVHQRTERGHVVEEAVDDESDGVIDRQILSEWDGDRLARRSHLGPDEELMSETTYAYDGRDLVEARFTNYASAELFSWNQYFTYASRHREIGVLEESGPYPDGSFDRRRTFTSWEGDRIADKRFDDDDDGTVERRDVYAWTGREVRIVRDEDPYGPVVLAEYDRREQVIYEALAEADTGALFAIGRWEYDCR